MDSLVVTLGTFAALATFAIARFFHVKTHGACNCTHGLLLEYGPASLILIVVVYLTVRVMHLRSKRREELFLKSKQTELELSSANQTVSRLIEFNDLQLATMEMQSIGRRLYCESMLEMILLEKGDSHLGVPEFGMLAFTKPNGDMQGDLYGNHSKRLELISEDIEIRADSELAINEDLTNINTSSLEAENLNMEEYQQRFHPTVRKKVGEIRNFLTYRIPGSPGGALILFNFQHAPGKAEMLVLKAMVFSLGSLVSIQDQLEKREHIQLAAMAKLAELAESRDPETGAHLHRIAVYSKMISTELLDRGLHPDIIHKDFPDDIYHSSPLHDIGKVGITDDVLLKPGKLNEEEYERMKHHAVIGARVLDGQEFMEMARDIAHAHHEKWDGSGYPKGLAGEDIPLCARIVAVVDVYDALTSKRVYKDAFSHAKTKAIMEEGRGKHFDPELLDVFFSLEDRVDKIREAEKD